MAGLLFVLLIVIPVIELWIVVQVAHHIGFFDTLGLLILISIVGAFLLKQQGLATWRRVQEALQRGEVPGREATDGFLILLGGALLLTPGFLSDAIGLLLLLPPTRALVKGSTRTLLARWARRRVGGPKRIYTATVVRSRRAGETATPPELGVPPAAPPRRNGDGSPDRG